MSIDLTQFLRQDRSHKYSNDNLHTLLEDVNLENNRENLQKVYDAAFLALHPYIYEKASQPPLASDYSLNFIWLNLNPQDRVKNIAQNIFNEGLNRFEKLSKSEDVNLKLLDVRHLKSLQGDLANALHPGIPVYCRVDLCKAAIIDHLLDPEQASPTYPVVSDIDVEPMSADQLFDQRTLNFLNMQKLDDFILL